MAVGLHVLGATIWVGGLFFAHVCLRPAAREQLDTVPLRALAIAVFERFLKWVGAAAVLLPLTGAWLALERHGPLMAWPWHVQVMLAGGAAMIGVYFQLAFALLPRLRAAFHGARAEEAGQWLGRIRRRVALNLGLGLAVVAVASGGAHLGGP